ncbi:MAG: hypothetical protein AB8B69_17625 [Chitinophagales bacterium]
MLHRYFPFYLLLLLVSTSIFAQNLKFLKKKIQPEWQANPTYSADIVPEFADEDVVVLKEAVSWKMNDQENTTLFRCNKQMYFATQKGIDQHSSITVPESIDPSYEYADVSLARRADIYRPKYFNLEILYFEARIIKPDGRVEVLPTIHKTEKELLKFDVQFLRAYAYHFDLSKQRIEVGDIVEIDYLYYLPFIFDWRRQFFHGDLPKQVFELTISHPTRLVMMFDYANNSEPNTLIRDQEKPYLTTRRWRLKNLEACMEEVGTRLHRDLPYITFYVHNKSFGAWSNDHITDFQAYTWEYFTHELIGFRKFNQREVGKFTVNRKNRVLDIFYKGLTSGYSDNNSLEKLQAIHHTITNDFGYQEDIDHQVNTDLRISKIPDFLRDALTQDIHRNALYQGIFSNRIMQSPYNYFSTLDYFGLTSSHLENIPRYLKMKTLRSISRNSMYQGIFNRLQEDYYTVHLSDKRVGRIRPKACLPIMGDNRLFAVKMNDEMHYIYPKKSRFGYAINELPFYLQHASGLHVAQMATSYKDEDNVLFLPTPQNEASDNYRRHYVKAKASLETASVQFEAEVNLSGQYATMMRGFYEHAEVDSSVNERYALHIGDLNPKAKTYEQKIDFEPNAPFKTTVRCTYTVPNLMTALEGTSFSLDLQNWIRHIFHEGFEAQNRDLPYYPDFMGQDSYAYQVEFEQPIAIKAFKDLPLVLENDFAKYTFNIEQQNEKTILIQSDFVVKSGMVMPEKAKEVELIHRAMKEVEGAKIEVRLVE